MHLDPDFECLTYGDTSPAKSNALAQLKDGDLLVFYGGLKPIYHPCDQPLIYALMGMFVVQNVVSAASVAPAHWYENAHVRRKAKPKATEVVVRGKPDLSGRFDRCIPIGEWRDGAYRVQQDLLDAWGGLSVNDGFIQRNVQPRLKDPDKFLAWLQKQSPHLIPRNN
jgi:hypothetical protein